MSNIKIDFHGGTHGNFLEFVANVFIMQTPTDTFDIFSSTGGSHNKSLYYEQNKIIVCGHFSSENIQFIKVQENDLMIQIILDHHDDDAYFICLTNLLHRSGDMTYSEQLKIPPDEIRSDPVKLRNNFYAKINERDLYIPEYTQTYHFKNKTFKFPHDSFFSYPRFCRTLNQLAFFLEQTFFPDKRLYNLWKKFMEGNTGWQSWNKCNKILNSVLSGDEGLIEQCTELEHAWINYNISKIARMYSGGSFSDKIFPPYANMIYDEIQSHLTQLRVE